MLQYKPTAYSLSDQIAYKQKGNLRLVEFFFYQCFLATNSKMFVLPLVSLQGKLICRVEQQNCVFIAPMINKKEKLPKSFMPMPNSLWWRWCNDEGRQLLHWKNKQ